MCIVTNLTIVYLSKQNQILFIVMTELQRMVGAKTFDHVILPFVRPFLHSITLVSLIPLLACCRCCGSIVVVVF